MAARKKKTVTNVITGFNVILKSYEEVRRHVVPGELLKMICRETCDCGIWRVYFHTDPDQHAVRCTYQKQFTNPSRPDVLAEDLKQEPKWGGQRLADEPKEQP